jgi:hypothetical protein
MTTNSSATTTNKPSKNLSIRPNAGGADSLPLNGWPRRFAQGCKGPISK